MRSGQELADMCSRCTVGSQRVCADHEKVAFLRVQAGDEIDEVLRDIAAHGFGRMTCPGIPARE